MEENKKAAEEQEAAKTENTIEENQEEVVENDILEEQEIVDELAEKFEKLNDSNLRLMADFDNYKKKSLKEKSDLIKYSGEKVFLNLLPVIDDMDLAILNFPEEESPLKDGILLIRDKFIAFLNQNGVKVIETEDAVFDTDYHEAITVFPVPEEDKKGKVVDCVQKGYTFQDKVIRYAKVVVAE